MNTWLKIVWFAVRHVTAGRLPHLRVFVHRDYVDNPPTSWDICWYVPSHVHSEAEPWALYDDIPF